MLKNREIILKSFNLLNFRDWYFGNSDADLGKGDLSSNVNDFDADCPYVIKDNWGYRAGRIWTSDSDNIIVRCGKYI